MELASINVQGHVSQLYPPAAEMIPVPSPLATPAPILNPLLNPKSKPALRSPHLGRLHPANSQALRPFPRPDSSPSEARFPALPRSLLHRHSEQ
jgi:hypothetical protein